MVGGEGDGQLWGNGRGALLGAIAGCHCSVLWCGEGRVTTLAEWTWCHCWVPSWGAIVVCYGWGEGWRPILGEWTWCHCWVPLLGAIVVGKGGLWGCGRGAIAGCHCRVPISVSYLPPKSRATNFTQTPKKTTMNLASCRSYTVLYIDNTKIRFCYLGSMLVSFFELNRGSPNLFHLMFSVFLGKTSQITNQPTIQTYFWNPQSTILRHIRLWKILRMASFLLRHETPW